MKNKHYLLICSLFIISCNQDSDNLSFRKEDFKDGNYVYHINIKDSLLMDLGFYSSGELNYIANFPNNEEQLISFYQNGIIKSKLKISSRDTTYGRAYYFYEKSGNLLGDYFYENGIRTGQAITYHDTIGGLKEVMLYNNDGELYYRKTFDWQGNHIKTEGSKD